MSEIPTTPERVKQWLYRFLSAEAGHIQRDYADALPSDEAAAGLATAMQAINDAALSLRDDDPRVVQLAGAYRQLQEQPRRPTPDEILLARPSVGPLLVAQTHSARPDDFISAFIQSELAAVAHRLGHRPRFLDA